MTILEFFLKQGIEKNLNKLLAEVIPLAIVRVREVIEGRVHGWNGSGKAAAGTLSGTTNIHGEKQLALDVQANDIFCEVLKNSGIVASYASEEMDDFVIVDESRPFTVVFDPLDGSSLVDVNFAIGSIFGVYAAGNPVGKKGRDQLAAGFVVYGPRTTMVLAVRETANLTVNLAGIHEFFMNSDGQFYLARENLKITDDAKYFAPGNLRACKERDDYKKLLNYWVSNGYTLRYSGGMVPDLNHIFLKGNGIFAYPPYSETPEGKLRLLYECAPMAFLAEAGGGSATDGKTPILEKEIKNLHQRTPIYIGSKNEVKRCEELTA